MSGVGLVALLGALAVTGVLVAISGMLQPAPSLERTLARLHRPSGSVRRPDPGARAVAALADHVPSVLPTDVELALVGRSRERHATWLLAAAVVGFVLPPIVLGALQRAGLLGLGWVVPAIGAVGGAVLGPVALHASTVERAAAVLADLRYQTSAYLDVVTMLLAANTGYEGALQQAAHAGDGRLFVELRRWMRESGTRGESLTEALRRTGVELGVDELEQVAATAALSASEGAPVARTLSAKCATLRAALATEQETEARLRTSRLTTPIVGMALIFMGLVIYPALSFS